MLFQERLIEQVRDACRTDERIDAALMYGSFAAGAGDEHSDVEFWLFVPDPGKVDPRSWCERIAPLSHLVRNESGADVAFFSGPGGPVRGEFHFAPADRIAELVGGWHARGAAVGQMVVKDRSGTLETALRNLPGQVDEAPGVVPATADGVARECGRFANWLVLARRTFDRGERLRAWDALSHTQRQLLWLVRLDERRTAPHWLTPSRAAETDLPAAAVAALTAATGPATEAGLAAALAAAWREGRSRWSALAARHGFAVPETLFAELDALFAADAA